MENQTPLPIIVLGLQTEVAVLRNTLKSLVDIVEGLTLRITYMEQRLAAQPEKSAKQGALK